MSRSRRLQMFFKIGLLTNFTIFTEKHLCWSLFSIKLQACRPLSFKLQITCFYLISSFFKKQRQIWHQSPCVIFCMIFEEKFFFCYILLTDQVSFVWLLLLHEILGNMCIVIICQQGCDVMNFEINVNFLIKLFSLHDQKVKTKS